jgi:hypothetical protein
MVLFISIEKSAFNVVERRELIGNPLPEQFGPFGRWCVDFGLGSHEQGQRKNMQTINTAALEEGFEFVGNRQQSRRWPSWHNFTQQSEDLFVVTSLQGEADWFNRRFTKLCQKFAEQRRNWSRGLDPVDEVRKQRF